MKKLFKKPAFWVILVTVIGLIVARIIQVKNNLKKNNTLVNRKISTAEIAKAFFTEPIYKPTNKTELVGNITTGDLKKPIKDFPGIVPVDSIYMNNLPVN